MKMMKHTVCLLALFVFSATSSFAQKCHFDVDKKDDFTGAHVRNVKVKIGNFFYSWWLLLEQNGTKYAITVQSAATSKIDDVIPKGSKILFKLDNDKVVEIVVSDDCVPNHNVQNNTIITTWLPKCDVSKETMQQLSQASTSLVRMNIGGKDFTSPNASGKEGKKVMEGAACLLQD